MFRCQLSMENKQQKNPSFRVVANDRQKDCYQTVRPMQSPAIWWGVGGVGVGGGIAAKK